MAKPNTKSKTSPEQTAVVTPPTPATSTTTAPTADASTEHRNNPRIDEKIDAWIKQNPTGFKYYNDMPHERAVRKLILNDIQRDERKQFSQQQDNGQNQSRRQERGQNNGNGRRY